MQEADLLIEKIREDTQLLINGIIAKAEKEADGILAEARAYTGRAWNEMKTKVHADSIEDKKRIISNTVLGNKKKILEAKQDMIEEAFDKAADAIRKMDNKEYEKFLSDLVVSLVSKEDAMIFVAYNDRSRLSPAFIENINNMLRSKSIKASVSYSNVDYDINDGFVLSQSKFLIDVSIKNLIGMQWEELENEVAKLLFV